MSWAVGVAWIKQEEAAELFIPHGGVVLSRS